MSEGFECWLLALLLLCCFYTLPLAVNTDAHEPIDGKGADGTPVLSVPRYA